MVSPNDKKILEIKKDKFISAVEKSAKYLDVKTPKIKFWKIYDKTHFNKGERAHIHTPENIICIAESELEFMNFEDIEDTASHEVSHLRYLNHDIEFQNIRIDTQASLWSPPAGTIFTNNKSSREKTESSKKKSKPDKKHCNYHLCKKKTKTYLCPFCEKYYCKEHLTPKPPSMLTSSSGAIAELLMERYRQENAHPCYPYSKEEERKIKEQEENYEIALGTILKPKRTFNNNYNEEFENTFNNILGSGRKLRKEHKETKKSKNSFTKFIRRLFCKD